MKKEWKTEKDGKIHVRTCGWSPPGDHPVGCGMILTVEDGKLVKVEGDPEHPISQGRLCPRCLALRDFINHPDRIKHPMKRAREDRGKDKWETITWDEALDIIEEKVRSIWAEYGPKSIVVMSGTGRESTLYGPALAYACFKTPNFTFPMSGCSCYGPRCSIADFLLGAGYPELDYAAYFPDRYDDPRYEIPKYIILWGKSPLQSNPDGFYGHSLVDLMKRGSKFITIDPRLTWIGSRAEYHLQLRPGTDAAVGLALLHVVIWEDLYDHDFVEKWVYGFEALKERVQYTTPEWAEEVTWVPAETLRGAARAFATNAPSSIMWGLAIDEQQNGAQAGQVLLSLAAICGYYDVPGGITLAKPSSFMGTWRFACSKYVDPADSAQRLDGREEFPAQEFASWCHADKILTTLETKDPYPIKMFWFYATNGISSGFAEPERWYKPLLDVDFNVVQDCFMTASAMAFCDLFLPVSGFAEHDGVVLPHFGRNTHFLGAMNAALDGGDAKSDLEIDMMIGKRLNPEAWPWESVEEFFDEQIATQYDWNFNDLREMGAFQQPYEYYKYEKGLLREDGQPGFDTATGMIEVNTILYKNFGEDPLPYFQEPFLSPFSEEISQEEKDEYPLILTTGGRSFVSFHTEHRQIPVLRKIVPDPIVTIHPETAAQYGIKDGDWVAMENRFGRAVQKAKLSYEVHPQVIHATHGWWYPEQDGEAPNLYGTFKSNPSSLVPNNHTGVLGYGANYKSVICKIYKVDGLDG